MCSKILTMNCLIQYYVDHDEKNMLFFFDHDLHKYTYIHSKRRFEEIDYAINLLYT